MFAIVNNPVCRAWFPQGYTSSLISKRQAVFLYPQKDYMSEGKHSGNYISSSLFDEPEYRDMAEMLVATYIIANRDMAGICPFRIQHVANACRTSTRTIRRVIEYFRTIGKLEIGGRNGKEFTHIWWRSGIYHSLFKGRFSEKQKIFVDNLVNKWHHTGIFGPNFGQTVAQLYATKYKIVIPIPPDAATVPPWVCDESVSVSVSDNESKTEKTPPVKKPEPTPPPTTDPKAKQFEDDVVLLGDTIRYMSVLSRTLMEQLQIQTGGNSVLIDKKMKEWAKKCSGPAWVMWSLGRVWERIRYKADQPGVGDPFKESSIKDPMAYLYRCTFPREFGDEPNFESPGGAVWNEIRTAEWWHKVFFEKGLTPANSKPGEFIRGYDDRTDSAS